MKRVGCAGLLNDIVDAVDLEVPRAAMPVIETNERQYARSLNVEGHISIVCELIQKMRRVGHLVAAGAVIGRTHVGAHADALIWPTVPHSKGVVPHWDHWWH